MTRMSKQEKRRAQSPRKYRPNFAEKTGPKKDNLQNGYKEHTNALGTENIFIPKIK